MSRERPILFSGPMVRAILDGRKTQTRRLVGLDTLQPSTTMGYDWQFRGQAPVKSIVQQRRHPAGCWQDLRHAEFMRMCPHGEPGQRLCVREVHYRFGHWEPVETKRTRTGRQSWRFVADTDAVLFDAPDAYRKGRHHHDPYTPAWHRRSSLFMPRWASRITLEITGVRVERLQDISEQDAQAEGVEPVPFTKAERPSGLEHVEAFEDLWNALNGAREPWDRNPWVWVVEFKEVPRAARPD